MEIIRNVERVQGRTLVLFESGWKVWLLPGMDPGFPLSEGTAVDRRQFEQYLMLQEYPSALEKAVSMLAARARSKKEIMDKLLALRYDPEVAGLVVYKLEKENLLDDEAFSAQWVRSRMKKYGAAKIAHELRTKGIESETVSQVLESCPESEQLENAVRLAEKKIRGDRHPEDKRGLYKRVTDMLLRRGYSWDLAKKAFEIASHQDAPE